jgi:PAS domain S-box-containing protein
MLASILIVDPDSNVSGSLNKQLAGSGWTLLQVAGAEEALTLITESPKRFVGLITTPHLAGKQSGWDIARLARQSHCGFVVGYREVGKQDWEAFGVPNSVLIPGPLENVEIFDEFLRQCQRKAGVSGQWIDASRYFPNRIALDTEVQETAVESPMTSHELERDRFLLMFDRAPSFIAILEGPNHRFTYANDAYLDVVERASVVGRTVLESFPEVVAQGFINLLDRVYATGEEFRAHAVELAIQRPGGERKTLFLDFLYHPVRDKSGEITGIFVQGSDVTERRNAEEQIKVLQNELLHVARLNAMGTLVSALAHELNQPLTAIANNMATAAILCERDGQSEALANCYSGTQEAALRAGQVIRRLRDMATRRDFERQPMALDSALREAIALASVGRLDCTIELRDVTGASVMADRIQIQQVLLNLIQNAFEGSDRQSCHVVISTCDCGGWIEVAVRDSGSGIEEGVLPTIFDSFVTTKVGGMGVGLSICRTIVEAHGGAIAARNNVDGGARVSFTLPTVAS